MRPRYRRPLFAALVVLVLGGVYAGAEAAHPATAVGSRSARPTSAPITSAVRVCAAPGSAGVTAASVGLAAVPGKGSAGSAVLTRLTPTGSTSTGPVLARLSRPGVLQVTPVKVAAALPKSLQGGQPGSSAGVTTQAGRGGVMVSATGAMAQGLEVEQTGPGGLVTAQCGSPGTSFWFAGPGQDSAADIELYLTNTGSQPADAEVSFLTDVTRGAPLLGNSDNGITIPPHAMVFQSLGKLLHSSKYIALNVSTSIGQVVASVRESSSASDDGAWLPATATPASTLIIPGMPASNGPRQLYIAVPGSAAAQVKVTAVTAKGSYQPTGGTGLDLLGDSINEIPISSLGGVAGALKISSTVPVAATMLLPGGPAGTPGVLAAAAGPVQEQGVIADNPAKGSGTAQLIISAPDGAATVRIAELTGSLTSSSQAGRTVRIKAHSSVVVPVAPPSGSKSPFALVVTPLAGSGPVYAARLVTTGGVVRSILPVPSSPTSVLMAPVVNSLSNIAN
jgi:Family of unknown function (DUF5719)